MTIGDNLTPRERQIRETLAGMRDEDDDGPVGVTGRPSDAVRRGQVERNASAFWFCPRCRARVPGNGSVCAECDFSVPE